MRSSFECCPRREAARILVHRGGMEALRTPETDPVAARLGQFPGRLEGGLPREWRVGLEADVNSRKVVDASQ